MSEPIQIVTNDPTMPGITGPGDFKSFQWPVVQVGPHPTDPQQSRVYVFTSNGGSCEYMLRGDGTGMPSSRMHLSYADFNTADIEDHKLVDLDWLEEKWVHQTIPYFDAMHFFNPELQDPPMALDEPFVRAQMTYGVNPNGPGVFFVGANNSIPQVWQAPFSEKFTALWPNPNFPADGFGPHDHVLVYSPYGVEGTWQVFPINFKWDDEDKLHNDDFPVAFERIFESGSPPVFLGYGWENWLEGISDPRINMHPSISTLNHKTAIWTADGSILFPAVYTYSFNLESDPDGGSYWWPSWYSIYTIRVNPANQYLSYTRVMPTISQNPDHWLIREVDGEGNLTPERSGGFVDGEFIEETVLWQRGPAPAQYHAGTLANPPRIPFPNDLDGDGIVDRQSRTLVTDVWGNRGALYAPFQYIYPIFHHDTGEMNFHGNQMRTTHDIDGVIAMMWLDSTKAKHVDSDDMLGDQQTGPYREFGETPELMIVASIDSGKSWSDPLVINKFTNPDLFFTTTGTAGIAAPSYVYPADRLVITRRTATEVEFILYFMLGNDIDYGSNVHDLGPDTGIDIIYAAVNLVMQGTSDADKLVEPKPRALLAQNFPNPFNPSTTISFDVPRTGNVKLSVYNIKGQLVKNLLDESMIFGPQSVVWNGDDNNNRSVASGVYFYRLETNGVVETKKMVLMK
jgi:hypothetical protein